MRVTDRFVVKRKSHGATEDEILVRNVAAISFC